MKTNIGFYRFTFHPALVFAAALMLLILVGCSNGGGSPVSPESENIPDFRNMTFSPGHNIIGAGTVTMDPVTGDISLRMDRTAEVHLELKALLITPKCPGGNCLQLKAIGYDAATYVWTIDMYLTNPTNLDAYDVRIIFTELPFQTDSGISWEVMNPDSYTDNHLEEPNWDASDEDWVIEDVGIKPFIAFEKDNKDRLFLGDPDGDGPEIYTDKEQLLLKMPPEVLSKEYDFLMDVCWPGHCNEPYQVIDISQFGALPPNNLAGQVTIEAVVADWQMETPGQDVIGISVWIPDIAEEANDYWVEMTEVTDWPPAFTFPPTDEFIEFMTKYSGYYPETLKKYECQVENWQDATVGLYPAIVRAESVDTFGQGFDVMYNIKDIKVATGGSGGDPDQNLMIVFGSYKSGPSSDIYAYSFKTGQVVQITDDGNANSEELDVCVNMSGNKICFASNIDKINGGTKGDYDLYTINLNNFPPSSPYGPAMWQPFATDPDADERLPDFSFDSTQIAYCSNKYGEFEIYRKMIGQPTSMRITYNYGSDEAPCWDKTNIGNTWLYFHSNRAGGGNYEIYGIDPTSQESSFNLPTRYTFNGAFDGYPSSRIGPVDWGFAWTSDRLGDPDIFYYEADWEWPINLTVITDGDPDDPAPSDIWPSISKDNTWVAFSSDRKNNNFDVWRVTVDASNLERVTTNSADENDPCYGGG